MIIDGKKIRDEIRGKLREQVMRAKEKPQLAVIYVGTHPAIDVFVENKKKFGEDVGIVVDVLRFNADITEDDLAHAVKEVAENDAYTALIVQLPLPAHIHAQRILDLVPKEKDADVLSRTAIDAYEKSEMALMPPVAGAMREIVTREKVRLEDKNVVIVGHGRLVGQPALVWAKREKGNVSVVLEDTPNKEEIINNADVMILGAGNPHMINPSMVKDGVVILDAGTSEQGGKVVGDADPRCADKAAIFTPVPGGIGPITVAMLFVNVLALAQKT